MAWVEFDVFLSMQEIVGFQEANSLKWCTFLWHLCKSSVKHHPNHFQLFSHLLHQGKIQTLPQWPRSQHQLDGWWVRHTAAPADLTWQPSLTGKKAHSGDGRQVSPSNSFCHYSFQKNMSSQLDKCLFFFRSFLLCVKCKMHAKNALNIKAQLNTLL